MRVCDYIALFLKQNDIDCFFGYQGGAVTPLIDAMTIAGLRYIQCYHEQASGFAAEAYARLTKKCSVTVVTNGPGATNLVSAIAQAHLDSIPCLFITGQVNTFDLKEKDVRQNGFQEIDAVSMARPLTKYAKQITGVSEVGDILREALDAAYSGRKGAVLLDIPMNILMSETDDSAIKETKTASVFSADEQKTAQALSLLRFAKRPLILIGGGVRLADAEDELERFVNKTALPTVKTLMGFDIRTTTEIGFSGNYGGFAANLAVQSADVILALGTRFAKRQVGKDIKQYAPNAQIIHVDIDDMELKHSAFTHLKIHADIKAFLNKAIELAEFKAPKEWLSEIDQLKEKFAPLYTQKEFQPVGIVKEISDLAPADAVITTDVGQNQMWVAQGWTLKKGQRFLTSGGLGCMGYSLPAAVGACFAYPERPVICFSGDGGFQMNMQELQSVSATRLPIKIFIFNNNSLGMIREAQMKYHDSRFVGTKVGYGVPDLEKLAFAYGIAYHLFEKSSLPTILNSNSPALIEIDFPAEVSRAMTRFDFPEIYGGNRS